MELFKLPRKLGQMPNGDEVEVNIGRFGPYARHGKAFVSLKKDDDPYTIELPRVIELIEQKAAALDAATIRSFEGTGIRIIKGRFGPYITDGSRKSPIPRTRDAEKLSVFECEAYLAEAEAAKPPKKGAKKKAAAKKAAPADGEAAAPKAPKKAAVKKAASKKSAAKKTTKKATRAPSLTKRTVYAKKG